MEKKKFVMIPGPTPVLRSIQNQMGRETTAFGDPDFIRDYKELIDDLNAMWNNKNGKTFVVAGTGTLAMEMAIANNTKKGDNVLIVSNGFFGDRFIDICERKGLNADILSAEWGKTISPQEIESKLSEKKYSAVTVTHVDTSTGVSAPIDKIGAILKNHPETIYIVDGVCATAAEPEDMSEMHIDVLFTGSQKAFGVAPGLMMLWASEKSLERRKSLGTIPEYYCDYDKWLPIMDDPSKYFATPAVNMVWALKESVRLIKKEGLENRYARSKKIGNAVQKAVESLGFTVLADERCRAVTLTNFIYFDGINDAEFRKSLLDEGIIVAGALAGYAGKAFRLGHMGNVDIHDLTTTIATIEKVLYKMGKLQGELGQAVGILIKEMA